MNPAELAQAEATLADLARVFFQSSTPQRPQTSIREPNLEARYRVLVDQIPAVLFLAYLEEGIGEAYVSPQIEATLGFTQKEWLEDPVRWYQQIHPEDKDRWSTEAAAMFLSGEPLRSAYRVLARNGRVVWFHCEARLVRREDGQPWFIHGVGFDITELKRTEEALAEERNVASAILDTVGALVVVTDTRGRIVRFNRACEQTTGYAFAEVQGRRIWELFQAPEELDKVQGIFERLRAGALPSDYESLWMTKAGERRLISWSSTTLSSERGELTHIIATGIDITERKRLEEAVLDISAREQRRIGQDLHDDLGQHLTGVAFMARVLQDRLAEASLPESADAAKIVALVNEAISRARELAHGLLPVVAEAHGLMSALERLASEISDLFRICCRFEARDPVLIRAEPVADHLYHLAQEAVNNAIKHGHAAMIVIRLERGGGGAMLTICDDGAGFDTRAVHRPGIGMRIMQYRARIIGGSLEVRSTPGAGAEVRCMFPIRDHVDNGHDGG